MWLYSLPFADSDTDRFYDINYIGDVDSFDAPVLFTFPAPSDGHPVTVYDGSAWGVPYIAYEL